MPLHFFACEHCGFWQRHFAPAACPVCEDFRHPLPADGWRFATVDAVAAAGPAACPSRCPGS
jgi:hypothetical protein